jgi:hypothetical protein
MLTILLQSNYWTLEIHLLSWTEDIVLRFIIHVVSYFLSKTFLCRMFSTTVCECFPYCKMWYWDWWGSCVRFLSEFNLNNTKPDLYNIWTNAEVFVTESSETFFNIRAQPFTLKRTLSLNFLNKGLSTVCLKRQICPLVLVRKRYE